MFLIRSMSTNNAHDAFGRAQKIVPYHVYLLPAAERGSAWWTPCAGEAAKFATRKEAEAAYHIAFPNGQSYHTFNADREIAPVDDRDYPTYWSFR